VIRAFDWWNERLPTAGVLGLAVFLVGVISGVVLAVAYDVRAASDSLELMELASPAGTFLRAVHAWTGHLLVILALLHVLDRLVRGAETRPRRGVWLRAVLSVPVLLLLMLSGFILKGDAEGALASEIVAGLLGLLPLIGDEATVSLLGAPGDLQLVYVHHVATATILVWVFSVEHARRLWPSAGAVVGVSAAAALLALAAPPGLHDGVEPVIKGPWYFVGVQEVLHWTTRPAWLWLAAGAVLALLFALPSLEERRRTRAKLGLALLLAAYALVSVWALGFRGAGWRVEPPSWSERPGSRISQVRERAAGDGGEDFREAPIVLGHREGCLVCHAEVTGLSAAHAPEALGCRSCHLGDPFASDAEQAHRGMVLVPGNLDTAALSCGQSGCHGAIVSRVGSSLMGTGRGIVAVDRFVFGEADTPDGSTSMADLGRSPADVHLKGLCVECHLGTLKTAPGPVTELSRGGGCAACHLRYPAGERRYSPDSYAAFVHPALTVQVRDESCFGCHSRSGRISLGYAGWAETLLEPAEAAGRDPEMWRVLKDERVLQREPQDVHHERGMACIDCHTSRETMGDGEVHLHEEDATEVTCADCHRSDAPRTLAREELDPETQAILTRRGVEWGSRRFVLAGRSARPLSNTVLEEDGSLALIAKLDGKVYRPKPPATECGKAVSGHERLSCQSCHSAWAPQCVSCHTQYVSGGSTRDPVSGSTHRGRYVEYQGEPRAEPPALGVREREGRSVVEPFVPGMIITVNTDRAGPPPPEEPPDSADGLLHDTTRFARLYAPVVPHTTTIKGRSCASCHSDPLAVGLGRGELKLEGEGAAASWRFVPKYELLPHDGLPADAWRGLANERERPFSTRGDARPFSRLEIEKILRVGVCLDCHDPGDDRQRAIYRNFERSLRGAAPDCVVPSL